MLRDTLWLDPVGGLFISAMVVKAGWGNTKTALLELADTAIDSEVRSSVKETTLKALKSKNSKVQVRDIQGMKSGQNYLFDVELAVPGEWSIDRSRRVEELIRREIGLNVLGAKRVKVRVVPLEVPGATFDEEFISPQLRAHAQERGDHHVNGNGNANHME